MKDRKFKYSDEWVFQVNGPSFIISLDCITFDIFTRVISYMNHPSFGLVIPFELEDLVKSQSPAR